MAKGEDEYSEDAEKEIYDAVLQSMASACWWECDGKSETDDEREGQHGLETSSGNKHVLALADEPRGIRFVGLLLIRRRNLYLARLA